MTIRQAMRQYRVSDAERFPERLELFNGSPWRCQVSIGRVGEIMRWRPLENNLEVVHSDLRSNIW